MGTKQTSAHSCPVGTLCPVTYFAKDNAGNTETPKTLTVKIDKTPPSIRGAPTTPPNANGWYKDNVTVHFTARDDVSGIASVTPDIVVSTEGRDQSVTGTTIDMAGNFASTTESGIKIDKTPPTISLTIEAKDQAGNTATKTVNFTVVPPKTWRRWIG